MTTLRRRQAHPKGSTPKMTRHRAPLHGHAYHNKTDAELRYIIKDAGEAALAMRDGDPAAEAKYLDQVNDACTVIHWRMNHPNWRKS